MRERTALLATAVAVAGAILLGVGYADSVATERALATSCLPGTFFPVATCTDLAGRLRADGGLMATGFVVLALGLVAFAIAAFSQLGRVTPEIPVHFFGPRSK